MPGLVAKICVDGLPCRYTLAFRLVFFLPSLARNELATLRDSAQVLFIVLLVSRRTEEELLFVRSLPEMAVAAVRLRLWLS